MLDLQLYAGLTLTDAVGTVYSIEYVTDLAQTNNVSAWRGLEFLHLHQFRSSSGHHRSTRRFHLLKTSGLLGSVCAGGLFWPWR